MQLSRVILSCIVAPVHCIASAKAIDHMHVFTMCYSSLMVKMAGTGTCDSTSQTKLSRASCLRYAILHTSFFHAVLSMLLFSVAIRYLSSIWLIYLHPLNRAVSDIYATIKINCGHHFTVALPETLPGANQHGS